MNRFVIDPGHGGASDAANSTAFGVRGALGTLEKDVTLELARRLARIVPDAVLTRSDDSNLSLADRCRVAQREQARAFVSLHANGGALGNRGARIFVHPRAGAASSSLAQALSRELAPFGAAQTSRAPMAVLTPERLGARTAACLLEVDYLSDPGGERRLQDPTSLDALAQAIGRALQAAPSPRFGAPQAPGSHERYSPGARIGGRARALDNPDGGPDAPLPEAEAPQGVSDDGIRFIARYEGFRSKLYNDPAGHCTIGYGHLVHQGNCDGSEPQEFKDGIDEARAQKLLRDEADSTSSTVQKAVTVPLTQAQFDALVSFAFNVGTANFRGSTLLKLLNQGSYDQVPAQLLRWVKGGGQTLPGLVRRRTDEGNLFANGDYRGGATSQGLALLAAGLDATLNLGVPGGIVTDGFYRDADERKAITGRAWGRSKHLGIDVSLSNAQGGGADDPRRGLPVYACPLGSIDIAALNGARATDSSGNAMTGLGIPGSRTAFLRDALVLTQPWRGKGSDDYGGVLGLACRYTYTNDDGNSGVFTLYLEYLHLITDAYPPKDGSGNVILLDDFRAQGKSWGFGPRMGNRSVLSAADLTADPPLLVGYLGATQFPHCHMQAAFGMGEQGYLRTPRFDPTVMLLGSSQQNQSV